MCKKCNNNFFQSKRIIYEHLIKIEVKRDYVIWDLHGEVEKDYYEDDDKKNYSDEIQSMLHDIESAINVEDTIESKETRYTKSSKYNTINEKTSKVL